MQGVYHAAFGGTEMTEKKMIKKKVVLEAYVQTSYDTFSHIFRTVEIEIPDDGNNWHVCGEMGGD